MLRLLLAYSIGCMTGAVAVVLGVWVALNQPMDAEQMAPAKVWVVLR